jgi:hypothetical protein
MLTMGHGRGTVSLLALASAAVLGIGTAAAAPRSATSGDQEILQSGVITANDVPSGWKATKQDASTKPFKGIAECRPLSAAVTAARRVPHKSSPQFADPSSQPGAYAENTVYAFSNAAAANQYLASRQGSDAPTCLQRSLQRSLGTNVQVSAGQPVANLEGVGDAAAGLEFQVHANVQGAQMTFVYDAIGVRLGRAIFGFTFANPNVTITQGPDIMNTVLGRVQRAAGG